MQLKSLSPNHCQAILEFETTNRTYFEAHIPPRPNGYFEHDSLHTIIKNLCDEQDQAACFFYLAYDNGNLIGRANLVNIHNKSAELGYRIAQDAIGQGHATKIIAELIKIAKSKHGLTRINAHTTTNNIASIRVLEKNGFTLQSTKTNAATLNGISLDFTYFTLDL